MTRSSSSRNHDHRLMNHNNTTTTSEQHAKCQAVTTTTGATNAIRRIATTKNTTTNSCSNSSNSASSTINSHSSSDETPTPDLVPQQQQQPLPPPITTAVPSSSSSSLLNIPITDAEIIATIFDDRTSSSSNHGISDDTLGHSICRIRIHTFSMMMMMMTNSMTKPTTITTNDDVVDETRINDDDDPQQSHSTSFSKQQQQQHFGTALTNDAANITTTQYTSPQDAAVSSSSSSSSSSSTGEMSNITTISNSNSKKRPHHISSIVPPLRTSRRIKIATAAAATTTTTQNTSTTLSDCVATTKMTDPSQEVSNDRMTKVAAAASVVDTESSDTTSTTTTNRNKNTTQVKVKTSSSAFESSHTTTTSTTMFDRSKNNIQQTVETLGYELLGLQFRCGIRFISPALRAIFPMSLSTTTTTTCPKNTRNDKNSGSSRRSKMQHNTGTTNDIANNSTNKRKHGAFLEQPICSKMNGNHRNTGSDGNTKSSANSTGTMKINNNMVASRRSNICYNFNNYSMSNSSTRSNDKQGTNQSCIAIMSLHCKGIAKLFGFQFNDIFVVPNNQHHHPTTTTTTMQEQQNENHHLYNRKNGSNISAQRNKKTNANESSSSSSSSSSASWTFMTVSQLHDALQYLHQYGVCTFYIIRRSLPQKRQMQTVKALSSINAVAEAPPLTFASSTTTTKRYTNSISKPTPAKKKRSPLPSSNMVVQQPQQNQQVVKYNDNERIDGSGGIHPKQPPTASIVTRKSSLTNDAVVKTTPASPIATAVEMQQASTKLKTAKKGVDSLIDQRGRVNKICDLIMNKKSSNSIIRNVHRAAGIVDLDMQLKKDIYWLTESGSTKNALSEDNNSKNNDVRKKNNSSCGVQPTQPPTKTEFFNTGEDVQSPGSGDLIYDIESDDKADELNEDNDKTVIDPHTPKEVISIELEVPTPISAADTSFDHIHVDNNDANDIKVSRTPADVRIAENALVDEEDTQASHVSSTNDLDIFKESPISLPIPTVLCRINKITTVAPIIAVVQKQPASTVTKTGTRPHVAAPTITTTTTKLPLVTPATIAATTTSNDLERNEAQRVLAEQAARIQNMIYAKAKKIKPRRGPKAGQGAMTAKVPPGGGIRHVIHNPPDKSTTTMMDVSRNTKSTPKGLTTHADCYTRSITSTNSMTIKHNFTMNTNPTTTPTVPKPMVVTSASKTNSTSKSDDLTKRLQGPTLWFSRPHSEKPFSTNVIRKSIPNTDAVNRTTIANEANDDVQEQPPQPQQIEKVANNLEIIVPVERKKNPTVSDVHKIIIPEEIEVGQKPQNMLETKLGSKKNPSISDVFKTIVISEKVEIGQQPLPPWNPDDRCLQMLPYLQSNVSSEISNVNAGPPKLPTKNESIISFDHPVHAVEVATTCTKSPPIGPQIRRRPGTHIDDTHSEYDKRNDDGCDLVLRPDPTHNEKNDSTNRNDNFASTALALGQPINTIDMNKHLKTPTAIATIPIDPSSVIRKTDLDLMYDVVLGRPGVTGKRLYKKVDQRANSKCEASDKNSNADSNNEAILTSVFDMGLNDWRERYELASHSYKVHVAKHCIQDMVDRGCRFLQRMDDGTRHGYYVVVSPTDDLIRNKVIRALRQVVLRRLDLLSVSERISHEHYLQKQRASVKNNDHKYSDTSCGKSEKRRKDQYPKPISSRPHQKRSKQPQC